MRFLTEWSKIHVHPRLLWSYVHVMQPITTTLHVHKSGSSTYMLGCRLFLFLICGVIFQEDVFEVELALLSNLSHVRVETEHDVLETEDGQGTSLVVEGSLSLLESYLVQGLQVLSHITILLLYEYFFLTRDIRVLGSHFKCLGNTQERFTSNLEGDRGQKSPLALVLNKAWFAFSLVERAHFAHFTEAYHIIKTAIAFDVNRSTNTEIADNHFGNWDLAVLTVLAF